MKVKPYVAQLVVCVWLISAVAAFGHHGFSSEFDAARPISITGVLTKVDWVNPHIYVYLSVKGEDGNTVEWAFETLPPLWFHKAGLQRSMLTLGETVTIVGYGAKDGSKHLGWIKKFRFADGRETQITADNPNEQAK